MVVLGAMTGLHTQAPYLSKDQKRMKGKERERKGRKGSLAMPSMDANDGVCVAETLLHVADAEP